MESISGEAAHEPPDCAADAQVPTVEGQAGPICGKPLELIVPALWLGLVVGLVELGLFLVRVQLTQHGLFRKSPHVFWMIPASTLTLFGMAGLLLKFLIRPIPKVGGILSIWLLCTLALLAPLLAVPGLWASCSLLLAAGLASWIAPAIRNQREGFRPLIRASLPLLGLALAVFGAIALARNGPTLRHEAIPRATARKGAPNLLFVVMDTVRADATNLHGSARNTTPNLSRLAQRGVRFERAIATSPWTLSSHASMFTGRWPWELTVGPDRALDGHYPTLAEYFSGRGYATAGFAANTVFCTAEYGLSRGFEHYEDFVVSPLEVLRSSALGWLVCRRLGPPLDQLWTLAGIEASHPLELSYYRKDAAEINRAAMSWITRQGDRPFFAFLNYLDAHDPYLVPGGADRPFSRRPNTLAERRTLRDWIGDTPRRRTPAELRLARDSYDDCIAYLDNQIGQFITALDRVGRLDNTVIVITSDHGEHFGEHNRDGVPIVGHRQSVYQPEIHVPLIIVAPRRLAPETVVTRPVSLRNLPATITGLIVGAGSDSPFPGRSFVPPKAVITAMPDGAEDEAEDEENEEGTALAEFSPDAERPIALRYQTGAAGLMRAVVRDDLVYHQHGDGREEYYNLRDDPGESVDLAPTTPTPAPLDQFRDAMKRLAPPSGHATAQPRIKSGRSRRKRLDPGSSPKAEPDRTGHQPTRR